MSEPKIVRRCPQCGETVLIPLVDRGMLEFFVCPKCNYQGEPAERGGRPSDPRPEGED